MNNGTTSAIPGTKDDAAAPCIMVVFGASGDLTRRLLLPSLYNLACDRRLPDALEIVAVGSKPFTSESFRAKLDGDLHAFCTRQTVDEGIWQNLRERFHYVHGPSSEPETYLRIKRLVERLDSDRNAGGNILFYLAVPPSAFAAITTHLSHAGLQRQGPGWRRVIIEKPFGHDLDSAMELNRAILAHWDETQVYRIDHYLGKETVQNLLLFRFANGIFEPLWNKEHIDHIQLTVAETVGMEGRGGYYDEVGVLRDMIQNHMFQMLAYVCMDPPCSFSADAIRNEKAKVLASVRPLRHADVARVAVRGQYGPGTLLDGSEVPGYRQEPGVAANSNTETFAALRLMLDNWRWDGVPIYLRSGKRLWKRETTIVVQFKKGVEALFRGTPIHHLDSNRLVFRIQPDQGIELRFQAKSPGPAMQLQKVNMRFDYAEAFEAARGTGYETLIYQCMKGDATLFSRTDLVESGWRIVQPILDVWAAQPAGDFPNYAAESWGPKSGFDLIEGDGQHWMEILSPTLLATVPLFADCGNVFLNALSMMLKPEVYEPGETIIESGDPGKQMYFVNRGQVDVIDPDGRRLETLREGNFFGEIGLLLSKPRTATVRASGHCDLLVLEQEDFRKVLGDYPQVVDGLYRTARERYEG